MTGAVLRATTLGMLRDRGALALAFLLPVAFFVVFAAIFAGGSGDAPRLDIAVCDQGGGEESGRLIRALVRDPALQAIDRNGKRVAADPLPQLSPDDVRKLVRTGKADVGLIVRGGASPLTFFGGGSDEAPPLTLVEDSSKKIAAQIVVGLLQKAYFTALPDVTARGGVDVFEKQVGALTPEQRARWDKSLAALRAEALDNEEGGESSNDLEEMIEVEQVAGRTAGQNQVAYYAGAVAVMFLLFSCAHGASVLLEEKDAGILDRVLAGPAGLRPLLLGKFLFLVLSGFLQVTLIFLVAWAIRGVDLPGHVVGYAVVTLAAAAAATGLALALTTACRTRRQASSVATIGILILSAVGGSMVPRFFMPQYLQKLGWATPNTWALEAYTNVFWRDLPLTSILPHVGVLLAVAAAGLLIARRLSRRWETI